MYVVTTDSERGFAGCYDFSEVVFQYEALYNGGTMSSTVKAWIGEESIQARSAIEMERMPDRWQLFSIHLHLAIRLLSEQLFALRRMYLMHVLDEEGQALLRRLSGVPLEELRP